MSRGLSDGERRSSVLDGAVEVHPVLRTSLIEMVAWRCIRDTPASREPRRHDGWVLTVLFDGTTWVESDRWSGLVDPCHAVLHPPGTPYSTRHPHGFHDHGCNLRLRSDLVRDVLDDTRVVVSGRAPLIVETCPPPAFAFVAALARKKVSRSIETLALEGAVVEMLDAAVWSAHGRGGGSRPRRGTERAHRDIAERVKTCVNHRYADKLLLDDLARAAHASPTHLGRIFRRQTGLSLHQYVLRRRLAAAAAMVLDGGLSLTTIAHDTGFSSHSHMTAAFRRHLGISPRDLRGSSIPEVVSGLLHWQGPRAPGLHRRTAPSPAGASGRRTRAGGPA